MLSSIYYYYNNKIIIIMMSLTGLLFFTMKNKLKQYYIIKIMILQKWKAKSFSNSQTVNILYILITTFLKKLFKCYFMLVLLDLYYTLIRLIILNFRLILSKCNCWKHNYLLATQKGSIWLTLNTLITWITKTFMN